MMPKTRASEVWQHRIVVVARRWIGTPFLHQASIRGVGCDCLGLVRGVWHDLYNTPAPSPPPYSLDWGDAGGKGELLWCACERHLQRKPCDACAPGDVVLLRMHADAMAKHLGICSSSEGKDCRLIHAWSGRTVVESTLSEPWLRRIVARFSFPHHRN